MLPQASSHQIHEARFSSQLEAFSSGVQKRGRALAPCDQNLVRERFFTCYISCIWMLYGKAYTCALQKIAARYQHSHKIFHRSSSYKILIKCTFCNLTRWMTHCLGCPGPSSRSCPLCTSLVTTLCKFYRCSKSMRNTANCMHCERWIPFPLWRTCKMVGKLESRNPGFLKAL